MKLINLPNSKSTSKKGNSTPKEAAPSILNRITWGKLVGLVEKFTFSCKKFFCRPEKSSGTCEKINGHPSKISFSSEKINGHPSKISFSSEKINGHPSKISFSSEKINGHLPKISFSSELLICRRAQTEFTNEKFISQSAKLLFTCQKIADLTAELLGKLVKLFGSFTKLSHLNDQFGSLSVLYLNSTALHSNLSNKLEQSIEYIKYTSPIPIVTNAGITISKVELIYLHHKQLPHPETPTKPANYNYSFKLVKRFLIRYISWCAPP